MIELKNIFVQEFEFDNEQFVVKIKVTDSGPYMFVEYKGVPIEGHVYSKSQDYNIMLSEAAKDALKCYNMIKEEKHIKTESEDKE